MVLRHHVGWARGLAIAGLMVCGIAASTGPIEKLTSPLTFALVACALCAAVAYVDFQDTIFIDATIVPLLLAAVLVGPAATFAVVLVAEFGAWARQRYRLSAALINTLSTGAPSVAASIVFQHFEERSGPVFYVLLVAVSAGALITNFVILVSLITLLDRVPVRPALAHAKRVFPAFALNVVLVVAATNVYVNVGLAAVVFVLVVVLVFTYLVAQVFHAREQTARVAQLASSRQHLASQALNAEGRERRRLANTLHDGAVQDLLTARQDLHEIAGTNQADLDRVDLVLEKALSQLRDVVTQLHPAVLERRGVESALEAVAREHGQRADLEVHLEIAAETRGLHSALVYSVARELIINAARHAHASNLWVRANVAAETLILEVEDDGRGLTPERKRDALEDGHLGLASIEDRVEAVDGVFSLGSRNAGGTRCRVVIPLDETTSAPTEPRAGAPDARTSDEPPALSSVGQD